jgi:hypothetical protein
VRDGRRRLNGDRREKGKRGTSPSGVSERERERGGSESRRVERGSETKERNRAAGSKGQEERREREREIK